MLKNKKGKKEGKKETTTKKEVSCILFRSKNRSPRTSKRMKTNPLIWWILTSKPSPNRSTQKEESKPKATKKKNDSQLDEREIDVSTIKIEKPAEAPKITSWVANSVEEVMKTEFKMEEHEHDFESLTDQEFNKKQE